MRVSANHVVQRICVVWQEQRPGAGGATTLPHCSRSHPCRPAQCCHAGPAPFFSFWDESAGERCAQHTSIERQIAFDRACFTKAQRGRGTTFSPT